MNPQKFKTPEIVSPEVWLERRKELLTEEKALTRQRDRLNEARRALPMVAVTKDYVFDTSEGRKLLSALFEGRHQLVVYHFMFEPGDPPAGKSGEPWDEGCSGCSFMADNVGHLSHFHARDTTLAFISRAPFQKISSFKERMGWDFPWHSSFGSDFNYDFHATTDESVAEVEYNYQDKVTLERKGETYHIQGEQPGISVFLNLDGKIYHTYSTYGRGMEMVLGTLHFLDLTPFGRGEGWGGMPDIDGHGIFWTRHHDKYQADTPESSCCHAD